MQNTKKAIVLLSGGLDSATCLAVAAADGYACHAISFDYGQRSTAELQAARRVAKAAAVTEHRIIPLPIANLGGSALTDSSIPVPVSSSASSVGTAAGSVSNSVSNSSTIPPTYVPARNTVFLAHALAAAEVLEATAIYIGVNAVDYSGYPDCRPEYIQAWQYLINLATRATVEGGNITLKAPLVEMSKADIIRLGTRLGVNYALTVSCYQADPEGRACATCDSCHLRRQGFTDANIPDPTRYRA